MLRALGSCFTTRVRFWISQAPTNSHADWTSAGEFDLIIYRLSPQCTELFGKYFVSNVLVEGYTRGIMRLFWAYNTLNPKP